MLVREQTVLSVSFLFPRTAIAKLQFDCGLTS